MSDYSELFIRITVTCLGLFVCVCLLFASSQVFAQKAAPFQLWDFEKCHEEDLWGIITLGCQYIPAFSEELGILKYNDPGSDDGTRRGIFSKYCVRVVERREFPKSGTVNSVIGTICGFKTSSETEEDFASGSETFPQQILQLQKCTEEVQFGHSPAGPRCGAWHDVNLILRELPIRACKNPSGDPRDPFCRKTANQ